MTKQDIVLYGASGHSLVVFDSALLAGFNVVAFRDDAPRFSEIYERKVLCPTDEIPEVPCVLTIGNNSIRKKIAETQTLEFVTIIHPQSTIAFDVKIGQGTVVMAGVVINPQAEIGRHCIINTSSIIEHEVQIGDYVHISPGAALAGDVQVGEGTHIGINATVIQGVKIGKWCTIGAGAVIIRDVPDGATVVGNPGTIIKQQANK